MASPLDIAAAADHNNVVTTINDPGVDTNVPTEKAVRSAIAGMSGGSAAAIRDIYRNLTLKNNVTNPNYQLDLAADEIVTQDTSYNPHIIRGLSVTVDITASGANGLDTGAEGASTWYYIWAIAKADATKAGLISASSTAPTMPAGYIYKALVGAFRNNGSSNFVAQLQLDRVCVAPGGASASVVASGTQTSATAVDCSAIVPPIARIIGGYGASYVNDKSFYVSATSSGLGRQQNYVPNSWGFISFTIPCPTVQNFYYWVDSGGSANVYVTSWYY